VSILQEEQLGRGGADELAHGFASVAANIVEDDDIAGTRSRQENLLDTDPEAHAIDRSLNEPRRIDPAMAQGRQEGHGLPAAVRNLGPESVPAWGPSPQGRHVCAGPGLVNEDQPLSFEATLVLCRLGSPPCHVGTIASASHHAFFEAELLGMHEVPHRVIVDLQAATGKLGNDPAFGKSPSLIRRDSQIA
jgi:hypothetical protein